MQIKKSFKRILIIFIFVESDFDGAEVGILFPKASVITLQLIEKS